MKKLLIVLGVIVVLVLVGGYFLLAPKPVSAAILYVERGSVEVDSGAGYVAGVDEMELKQGSKVRTGDGEATVVFFEGELMHLEANSEVVIEKVKSDNVKVKQLAGETWNKVTRISGVSEYSVETPSTVATVRGTEFSLSEGELDVVDGEVDFEKKADKKLIKVRANKRVLADKMEEEDLPAERLARLQNYREKRVQVLKRLRDREIRKHQKVLSMAKERGVTEEKIRQTLNDIDEGREDEEKFYNEVPSLMKPRAKRIYLLTKEIKRSR